MKRYFWIFGLIIIFVSCQNKDKEFKDHYIEGLKKLEISDFKGALVEFETCIKLKPENPESYYYRGSIKSNLKDSQGAIADFTKAIELNPNYADAYWNRGLEYDFLGKKDEKCKDFHQAYDLGKTNIENRMKECRDYR